MPDDGLMDTVRTQLLSERGSLSGKHEFLNQLHEMAPPEHQQAAHLLLDEFHRHRLGREIEDVEYLDADVAFFDDVVKGVVARRDDDAQRASAQRARDEAPWPTVAHGCDGTPEGIEQRRAVWRIIGRTRGGRGR